MSNRMHRHRALSAAEEVDLAKARLRLLAAPPPARRDQRWIVREHPIATTALAFGTGVLAGHLRFSGIFVRALATWGTRAVITKVIPRLLG